MEEIKTFVADPRRIAFLEAMGYRVPDRSEALDGIYNEHERDDWSDEIYE